MRALIDSDVLIDFLQGIPEAREEIGRYDDSLFSVVSWMEVMCSAETEDARPAPGALFASMRQVDLTPAVAAKAMGLRR